MRARARKAGNSEAGGGAGGDLADVACDDSADSRTDNYRATNCGGADAEYAAQGLQGLQGGGEASCWRGLGVHLCPSTCGREDASSRTTKTRAG